MSPLLNVDLFEWGSAQVEEYDEGFKYLMHEECMSRTQETYQHGDYILFYFRDMYTKVTCTLNNLFSSQSHYLFFFTYMC